MFVKYFNDTDKLNHISYENNNANTTLKLDIERTMPLQKYNMSLWLIDRYNNFEELIMEKEDSEMLLRCKYFCRGLNEIKKKT